jgi:hypothetical protein
MKRCRTLLFVVLLFLPIQVFAECDDPAKVAIGFSILLTVFLFLFLSFTLVTYWLVGGRKYAKRIAIFMVLSLIFGVFSITLGLLKEQSKNHIPFLQPVDCE